MIFTLKVISGEYRLSLVEPVMSQVSILPVSRHRLRLFAVHKASSDLAVCRGPSLLNALCINDLVIKRFLSYLHKESVIPGITRFLSM